MLGYTPEKPVQDGHSGALLRMTTSSASPRLPELLATAILDRLLPHSHVIIIKNHSYRLRDLEQAVSLRA